MLPKSAMVHTWRGQSGATGEVNPPKHARLWQSCVNVERQAYKKLKKHAPRALDAYTGKDVQSHKAHGLLWMIDRSEYLLSVYCNTRHYNDGERDMPGIHRNIQGPTKRDI